MTGKTYFVFLRAGGKLIDAVMEVLLYLEMDPVEPGMEKHTPLFRHASGEAFRREEVAAVVKRLMASIGLDPNRFGAHSLRIGGATAALAAGTQTTTDVVFTDWGTAECDDLQVCNYYTPLYYRCHNTGSCARATARAWRARAWCAERSTMREPVCVTRAATSTASSTNWKNFHPSARVSFALPICRIAAAAAKAFSGVGGGISASSSCSFSLAGRLRGVDVLAEMGGPRW